MTEIWDAIVIGAGPAGMGAASRLAEGGARVLTLDQQNAAGGQIYRSLGRNRHNALRMTILGAEYAAGIALLDRFARSGAVALFDATVWRLDPNGDVWIRRGDRLEKFAGRNLVIACGAMERPTPLPGWTLPGVLTVGALQIMMKGSGIVPDDDIVLAGTGPLLYLYATQWLRAGGRRMTILDTVNQRNYLAAAQSLPKALLGGGFADVRKGLRLLASMRNARIAVHTGVREIEILGSDHVEGVVFSTPSKPHTVDCRTVGLHQGVIAHQQMARSVGCVHLWHDGEDAFRPQRDGWGETSVPSIYVAGDAGGIVGARASELEGEIAALGILARLGLKTEPERDRQARAVVKARRAAAAVRPLLQALYRAPGDILRPADDVVVCRCEAVTAGEVRTSVDCGSLGPNQTKAYLRTGMGPCQGRVCGPCVSAIIAQERKMPVGDVGYYRVRAPLVPIPASAFAALNGSPERPA